MKTILLFGYLTTWAYTLSYIFKKKIEQTYAVTIFLNVLLLYICGILFEDLRVGIYLCFAGSVLCAGYLLYRAIVTKKDFWISIKQYLLTPGFFLFAIIFAVTWELNLQRVLYHWDEFSHWGLVVKNMCVFDRLGNYELSTVTFRGYPPATALWQYFVTKFYGVFHQEYAYRAMGWLIAALIVPIVSRFRWKRIVEAAVFVAVGLLMPCIFLDNYFISLYVDILLGIVFGSLLFQAFSSPQQDAFYYGSLTIGMAFLCLIKASGAFLAIVIGVILIVEAIVTLLKNKEFNKKTLIRCAIPILCLLIALLVGKFSWTIYLDNSATTEAWDTSSVTLKNILAFLQDKSEEYQYNTLKNFKERVFMAGFSSFVISMGLIHWIVASAIGLLIVKILGKENAAKAKRYALLILGGQVVYILGMLVLYLFTYTAYEAERLASFARYMSTYVVGVLLFIIAALADISAKAKLSFNPKYVTCAVAFSLFFFLQVNSLYVYNEETLTEQREEMAEYTVIEQFLDDINPETDNVAVISQQDTGLNVLRLAYFATPLKLSGTGAWSLGAPYYSGDIWTVNFDAAAWMQHLQTNNVNCVFLFHIDEQFINTFSECFVETPQQHMLYRLQTVDGVAKLVAVQ